jgi:hypothetical protein
VIGGEGRDAAATRLADAGIGKNQIRSALHSIEPSSIVGLVGGLVGNVLSATTGFVLVLATVAPRARVLPRRRAGDLCPPHPQLHREEHGLRVDSGDPRHDRAADPGDPASD